MTRCYSKENLTKTKRPLTLTLAAALLVLAALLAFASPLLPGGPGGFAGGQRPAGAGLQPGQLPGQGQGQPPSFSGQPPTLGTNGGPGGPTGAPGGSMLMNLRLPLRVAAAALGGLGALMAALGLWRRKKWGMVIALVVAVGGLLAAALTFLAPVLGRSPWLMLVTGAIWQAVALLILAVSAAVLVLLPTSQKGYVSLPRERHVM